MNSHRVLLVGGSGFVGSALAVNLLARGDCEVFCFDRNEPNFPFSGRWFKGDCRSQEDIGMAVEECRPDRVYYLCSRFQFGEKGGVGAMLSDSLPGIYQLIDSLAPLARFVYVGSSAQYGLVSAEELPVSEDHRCEPVSDYGCFKLAEEAYVRRVLRERRQPGLFARIFNITGPGEPTRMVGGALVAKLRENTGKLSVRNLSSKRDFLDVRDVASALEVIGRIGKPGLIYNVASGRSVKINAYLEILLEAWGRPVEIYRTPGSGGSTDLPDLYGSNRRLRNLGWNPQYSLKDSIEAIVNI